MKYEFIPHTADVQFKAYGKSLEECFSNCVSAFTKSVSEDKIKEKKEVVVNVKGKDLESLLYNFLEELVVFFDSEYFLVSSVKKIEIDFENMKLKAVLIGDSEGSYDIHSHVKAVTYNEMFVRKENGKWVAQVTLDV